MTDFFRTLFSADGFMPHGHCYLWNPGVLWLHIASDALIALAYYSIPFTLVYFIRKRRDIPFNWMFLCFAVFIVACGTTHLMEIVVIWHPIYWLSGSIKAITAIVSLPTAVLLVKLLPQAIALPSPATLRATNEELAREVAERKRAEADARRLNDELELRVAERMWELASTNETLRHEIQERQRAEQASRDNQQLLQAIIDNSTTVIYVKDLNGRYILVNRRFLELFHKDAEEVAGRTDHDLFVEETAEAFRAMDKRVIAANEALTEEESAPHDDGMHTYVSVKSLLRDEQGKPYALFGVSTDITEHKRDAERTKWLASFPERNPNPIVELDFATGTIHYQNPMANKLFPDLQTRRLDHPYLAGMLVAHEALRIGASRPFQREIGVGGTHYSQTITYVPESRRLRIYATDITELKQTEEQLKASLKEVNDLKAALDEHAIVAITDPQGKITYVNEKFCSISKRPRSGLLGQDHRIVNSGYHSKEFFRDLWTTIAGGGVWHGEIKNRAEDGTYYWVDTTIVPFLNDNGKPRQYVATGTDITERKRTEAALQESEKRFRTMANSIPPLAWIARPDGHIVWYNQRWYNYTGSTPEQMLGSGWQSVHDPERLPEVLARWNEAIALGQQFEMEFPLRGADGQFRRFLTRALPLKNEDGVVEQWFGTNTDVDALKSAEEEIKALNTELEARVNRRTVELQVANRELEAFSYSVSHDLRAPLRAINGFAGIVLEDFGPKLPAECRDYLERMRKGGLRMGELIDDLLAFARLSRQPLNRQSVDITQLVHDVLTDLHLDQSGRNIETRIGDLPVCQGDRALLKQVWINLLSNAVKYSRDRNPSIVEIGTQQDNGQCAYFVRDNGVGFDMQYSHKLFGVFQRLHRVEEFEGTGVGLAIVQRIVHRHGGRVWAAAEPNRGATFYFTLEQDRGSAK